MEPTIVCPWDYKGLHNEGKIHEEKKLKTSHYQDTSIIAVTPTRALNVGPSVRWVSSMLSIMKPMNQRFLGPVFLTGMEVGQAYNKAVNMVLTEPICQGYTYMLTWEDDVLPQPDALLELVSVAVETDADIVSSMYWSKGEGGFPMIYGDITDPEINQRPIIPNKDRIRWCYGTGMGFTLFKIQQFRDYPMDGEWFKSHSEYDQKKQTVRQTTQDLYYMEHVIRRGGKICVAQKAKCGHYEYQRDIIW